MASRWRPAQTVALQPADAAAPYVVDVAHGGGSGSSALLAAADSSGAVHVYATGTGAGAGWRLLGRLADTAPAASHGSSSSRAGAGDGDGGGGGNSSSAGAALAFAADAPTLLATADAAGRGVRIWDLRAAPTAAAIDFRPAAGPGAARVAEAFCSVALDAAGTLLAAGSAQRPNRTGGGRAAPVVLWDTRRADRVRSVFTESHTDDVTQLAFCPHRPSELASAAMDGLVCVFECRTAQAEEEALAGVMNAEASVARIGYMGRTSERLWLSTHCESLSVFDVSSGRRSLHRPNLRGDLAECGVPVDYIVGCWYAPLADGHLRAVVGTHDGHLHVVRVRDTGALKHECVLEQGHSQTVRCLSWCAARGELVTGGEDALLCAWTVPGGADALSASGARRWRDADLLDRADIKRPATEPGPARTEHPG